MDEGIASPALVLLEFGAMIVVLVYFVASRINRYFHCRAAKSLRLQIGDFVWAYAYDPENDKYRHLDGVIGVISQMFSPDKFTVSFVQYAKNGTVIGDLTCGTNNIKIFARHDEAPDARMFGDEIRKWVVKERAKWIGKNRGGK